MKMYVLFLLLLLSYLPMLNSSSSDPIKFILVDGSQSLPPEVMKTLQQFQHSLQAKSSPFACSSLDGPFCSMFEDTYLDLDVLNVEEFPGKASTTTTTTKENFVGMKVDDILKQIFGKQVQSEQLDVEKRVMGPSDTVVSNLNQLVHDIDEASWLYGEGFFTNINDFYGNDRKEFLYIYRTEQDTYEALKLVGDSNVPRGRLSFRTLGNGGADEELVGSSGDVAAVPEPSEDRSESSPYILWTRFSCIIYFNTW